MKTSWLELLAEQKATLTGKHVSFAAPAEEAALAAKGSVLTPLEHLGLIRLAGEDAFDFLHKLGSNDINSLKPEQARYNSINSPKGRMLASLLVWRDDADLLLAVSHDLRDALARKLSMYVLRAKVKVSVDDSRVLLGVAGPAAVSALAACGLVAPEKSMEVSPGASRVIHPDGARYIVDCDAGQAPAIWVQLHAAGLQKAGTAAWRWLDIQAGIPLVTAATQDEFVAQMLNYELLGGVNFQKGCYPGQEIVARTQYLGKLKKRMYRAHAGSDAGVQEGSDLYSEEFGEQSCGKVVSLQASPAGGWDMLAVMQISAFESGKVRLGSPTGPELELSTLPYTVD